MEVLKFTTTIDDTGHLHLDIPTDLSSKQVDVVVILNPSSSDLGQRASTNKVYRRTL